MTSPRRRVPTCSGPIASKRAQDAVQNWPDRIDRNGRASGLFTDYHYYGAGDIGGAPLEASLRVMEAIVTRGSTVPPSLEWITARYPELPEPLQQREPVKMGDGPVRIVAGTAEQMFLDIEPGQTSKLPRYQGDLLLTKHSTGVLTSQAYMKRWNRQNELLADGAERASVGAEWLGGRPYPRDRLLRAWQLVLAGQFHDILPGTSLPKAYEYSWNDEVLAMNQFAGILTSASEAIASRLDTQAEGTAVVVYNPLEIEREDVVEAKVSFPGGEPKAVAVVGPDGKEAPAQLAEGGTVLFLAKVPSVGYAVYDVRPAGAPAPSTLAITSSTLENHRYRIAIDGNGDVSSIFDKTLEKEILSAPHRLAFQSQMPKSTPAWDFDWKDQKLPPRGFVAGPAKVRILENGPVRVALEITRESEGSRFVQAVRLAAGDPGNRVELANVIDWKSKGAALKATFALDATHPEATYSWGIGSVRRGNNDERMYEVPAQQWFDLTDTSGAHGVTVLSDCKYGVDKPDDNTLRLTLLYSPAIDPENNSRFYPDQATQDWGHHEFVYGLASHDGDRRRAQTDWHALRLNQPLVAFESRSHAGPLGRRFSLLRVSDSRVRVLALKKAEESDEIVVRLAELDGRSAPGVRVTFPSAVTAAREISGAEAPLGRAQVANGDLTVDLPPSGMRSFALKLAPPRAKVAAPRSTPVALPYDLAVATLDGARSVGGFDASGNALAAEMVPAEIEYAGIRFDLAPATSGKPNALVARGQALPLPAGKFNRAYVLAAATGGDQPATFRAGAAPSASRSRIGPATSGSGTTASGAANSSRDRPATICRAPAPEFPGVPGPRTGLHQTGAGGVVRLASPHGRRSERAVRLHLSLRHVHRPAGRREDADPSRQREDPHPGGHGERRGLDRASGAAALRHVRAIGGRTPGTPARNARRTSLDASFRGGLHGFAEGTPLDMPTRAHGPLTHEDSHPFRCGRFVKPLSGGLDGVQPCTSDMSYHDERELRARPPLVGFRNASCRAGYRDCHTASGCGVPREASR